ncbi:InlB B-repeat-containing protein, partial [Serratia marcescens]|uniref:InlB B-repeat-containing protein n=1 Tax=Serratia marcescens TaxID=615 RepID=UPI0016532B09
GIIDPNNHLVAFVEFNPMFTTYHFTYDGSQDGVYRGILIQDEYDHLGRKYRKEGISDSLKTTWQGYVNGWQVYDAVTVCGASYTVNYDGNGAAGGNTVSSFHQNGNASNLSVNGFSRRYYTFSGWNSKPDGSGTWYGNGQSVTGMGSGSTFTLYAQWNRTSSIVTFKDWNGTVLKTEEVSAGAAATPPPNPSRTGYTFTGWEPAYSSITDHTTITARYAANTYTIVYHGNGATGGGTEPGTYWYDSAKALTGNGFNRTYYTFKNWNTKADGSGTTYSNGQWVSSLTPVQGETIPLYAQWTRSSSLVTYKNDDGSTLKTQEVAMGGSAVPPSNPVRTGYTFTGWDQPSSNIQDHTTITAQYSINSYPLTLNGNGGTVNGNSNKTQAVTYTDSFDQLLKDGRDAAERTGYTFSGWYTEPSGGSAYSYSGNVMPAGEVTVYAHWTANVYRVSYDSDHVRWNGGIFQENHMFDTELGLLPSPEIYGWKFLGWRTEKKGAGEKITEHYEVEPKDVTYYGSWEPEPYQIRYLSEADHPSGISVQTFPKEQIYDRVLGELPQPEEPGYTFTGWFDGSRQITPEDVFSPASGAEGYTYRGSWEANTYHIRLLGNHYKLDQVLKEFNRTYNTTIGALPEPEIPGYTFLGWFDRDGNKITADNWVEYQDADYEAHWMPNRYTISFHKNLYAIGENPEDKTVTYDEVLGELPELSTDGYTFMGWYTDPEAGEKVKEDTPVSIGDRTYYAHWSYNTYVLKLITDKAISLIRETAVIYDKVLGALPIPELEDFAFRGWYAKPYRDGTATPGEASKPPKGESRDTATPSEAFKLQEGILRDTATPSEALRVDENTVYKTATSSEAYAYFDLVYQEEGGNQNRRGGKDGILKTDDDNFYFNGKDQIPGTTDDRKIYKGSDGKYGTRDDSYELNGCYVYPGPDGIFGNIDDYMDLLNGTNVRPGESDWWDAPKTLLVNNGYDETPGTRDDWIWEDQKLSIIRKPGPDGIFFTEDDEIWWIGLDKIPGTADDNLIYKGLDGKYGTADDFRDNENETNTRAGADRSWGTGDDERWWNGPDKIPGTADDKLIEKGMDRQYGTADDFIDNEDGTNTRSGADGTWGTEDDEQWWNGADGLPGNEDDYRYKSHGSSGSDKDKVEGWVYNASEKVWSYYYHINRNIVSKWAYLIYNGVKQWYYFDANGIMVTGWYEDAEGKKYYLHEISDGTK